MALVTASDAESNILNFRYMLVISVIIGRTGSKDKYNFTYNRTFFHSIALHRTAKNVPKHSI